MSPSSPVSVGPVVREWMNHLVWLEASLRDDPHQFQAWRRHIQIKVLKFLVRRYSDRSDVRGPRLDELFQPSAGTVPEPHSRICSDRTSADFLPHLHRIAEANRTKV